MKIWKRSISLLLALAMSICLLPAAALPASAEVVSGDFGDLTWTVDREAETLTISGTGPMPYCLYSSYELVTPETAHPWDHVISDCRAAIVEEGVSDIGDAVLCHHGFLSSVSIPNTVTRIGYWGIADNPRLHSVVIPDSVQSLGAYAFFGCDVLDTVSFGSGLRVIESNAFSSCGRLREIELPENLYRIEDDAFSDCYSLTDVRIPDSVAYLGWGCFYGCSALKRAELGTGVRVLSNWLFSYCPQLEEVLLPAGLTEIEEHVFYESPALADLYYGGDAEAWAQIRGVTNMDLTSVRLHCGVEQIDGHWTGEGQAPTCLEPGYITETCACGYTRERELPALGHDFVNNVCTRCGAANDPGSPFSGGLFWCYDDETHTLTISGTGDMDLSVELYAPKQYTPWETEFYEKEIQSVVIEEGVTSIGCYAFQNLDHLTSVSISDSVTKIETCAFLNCRKLPSVVIPESVQTVGNDVFYYCKSLSSVTLSSRIPKISMGMFGRCRSLTEIELPENLTKIDHYAFICCESLTGVRIPDSVTQIGNECFANCGSLKRAEVGKNVKEIPDGAFENCVSLEELCLPAGLTTIDSTAFRNTPALADIYYGGGEETWAQINGAQNLDLTAIRLHCGVDRIEGHWTAAEQAPTCLQPGFRRETCPCGYIRNEETFPAQGHDYVDGVCTRCGGRGASGPFGENLTWSYDEQTQTLTISGTGTMPEFETLWFDVFPPMYTHPWYAYQGEIRAVVIEEGVQNIGTGAFCDEANLRGVSIPDTVTEIGEDAFTRCSALASAVVPDSVITLGDHAFYRCDHLAELYLGSGLTDIGDQAFYRCGALTDLYYGDSEEAWARINGASGIDLSSVRFHSHVDQIDGHWTVEEYPPTCLQPGFRYKTCPCGYMIDEELPALGHCMAAWTANNDGTHFRNCTECGQAYESAPCAYEEVVTPPTVTEQGFSTFTCSACGSFYIGNYTEPLGEAFLVRFSVPDGVARPADMICYANRDILLPTVEAPEGYAFQGWVTGDWDNAEVCPETVLTGRYTASGEITLKALFRYAPFLDNSYELVTEQLPEGEKAGNYVITTGKTAEAFMMKAIQDSYTGNPDGMTRISASAATLENGVLRNVPLENVFQIRPSDTEERYYLMPLSMPERYISVSDTTLTTTTTLSDSCKWRIGYAVRTGRYGFLPHTDETRCVNCDGTAFVLSIIQGNSGQFLWKQKAYYTTVLHDPTESPGLRVYSNISVGVDMVVNLTARKSDLNNCGRFWIEVVKHEPEGDKTYRYGEGQPDGELIEKESTWTVRFTDITAKEMGVALEARLCAEDANGTVWKGPVRGANIRDYLAGRLTVTNNKVEQRVLAADMLNYGAAAQLFLNYETDHLVNEELTAEQLIKLHEYETKELPPAEKINRNTQIEGQSNILFYSMTLGNEVLLNLAVILDESTENVQFLVKDHATGAVVTTLDTDWEDSAQSSAFSAFHAIFHGVGADKMRTEYDFVTLVDGVETGNIRTWSVEGYVREIRLDIHELKIAMANALLTYGDSAAAYFAAQ